MRQGSVVRWALARARTRLLVPAAAAAGGRPLESYASLDASRREPQKKEQRQTQRFLYTLARTRVWDPAGILPQRGQVVERPRLAPRRLQRRRRRRLVGAEPDGDARQTYGGEQLELH